MCIAKNEEALAIDPHFAECYGNMANAWKVVLGKCDKYYCVYYIYTCIPPLKNLYFFNYVINVFFFVCRRKAILILQFVTILLPFRSVSSLIYIFLCFFVTLYLFILPVFTVSYEFYYFLLFDAHLR